MRIKHVSTNETRKTDAIYNMSLFLVADTQLYKRLCPSVGPSIRWSVRPSMMIELESVKTRISAPAHLSATGIGRVSDLVFSGSGPEGDEVL